LRVGLSDIILMQDIELFNFIVDFLKEFYGEVVAKPFFYVYGAANHPICLVAHIDTVRPRGQKVELIFRNNVIFNKHGVLGADDRAGVFAILKIVELCRSRDIDPPAILFTNYEETGAIGSIHFLSDNVLDEEVRLFIALDRHCANDYVFYGDDLPTEAKRFIESYGYVNSIGTFSDVALLSEFSGVTGINISIGFYREHLISERLHIDEMILTITRVLRILASCMDFRCSRPARIVAEVI
jgi:di/tripeptidase